MQELGGKKAKETAAWDKQGALKHYFGHSAFRPGQEKLIDRLLSGGDVLGVMPTGAGKSICYQLPALLLPGLTLVISPLISLMKDQVNALTQAGIPAAFLNSTLTSSQYKEVFRRASAGQYKLIYVAPERLVSPWLLELARRIPISLLAVDEAHCVSQWGQDFRPSYLKIVEFISQLPQRPTVGAFTATATDQVKQDVIRLLELKKPLILTTGFDRPNLYFQVARPQNKGECLKSFLNQRKQQSGIIYAATRTTVERLCEDLKRLGFSATRYHAGLGDQERRRNQEDFLYDRAKVMIATNAFGMGIDKSNVSFVVHYNMPKDLESYYQEAGRAGRDGEPAHCLLLFAEGDVQTARYLIENGDDNGDLSAEEKEALLRRDRQRLAKMTAYCRTDGCLRNYILRYFGEQPEVDCGHCGNCGGDYQERDITVVAQKILSAVARVRKKCGFHVGAGMIVKVLQGSRDQRLLKLGLEQLPTYGSLRECSQQQLRDYVDALTAQGYMALSEGEYPVLSLTQKAKPVLLEGAPVCLRVRQTLETAADVKKRQAPPAEVPAGSLGLLSALKDLRTRLAVAADVPAYIIFSNATLNDMAVKRPHTLRELMEVSGVGEVKASRWGQDFLRIINEFDGIRETAKPRMPKR